MQLKMMKSGKKNLFHRNTIEETDIKSGTCGTHFENGILSLIVDYWICQKVTTIDHFPAPDHLRVLLAHQPAHVGEEETPFSVVRIGVRLTEFVMNSMVSGPFVDWNLIYMYLAVGKNKMNDIGYYSLPGQRQFVPRQPRGAVATWP